jgi:PAS domain S-box-containing protein
MSTSVAVELNSIVEESPSAVLKLDRQWRIVYLNREARRLLAPSGDVIGMDHWEAFPHSAYAGSPWRYHYHRAMDEGIAAEFEHNYPDPLNLCTRITVRPLPDGIALYFKDITAERDALQALRIGENRLRVAVDTLQLGMWEVDIATRKVQCSETCKRNYGRSAGEKFEYEDMLQAVLPEDLPGMLKTARYGLDNCLPYRVEYRVRWPDGTVHWVLASGQPLYNEAGEATTMLGVNLDVTERHQAAEALMQTEKLAAVGRLAASIAHEINNPLEAVTNLLYLARGAEESPARDEFLSAAEAELRRVGVIANQTLRFHKQSTRPRSVTCEDLFESVLSIYQGRMAGDHVRLEKRKRARLPVVCFDGEIRQVLSNLLGNAMDAMGSGGGRILLRSRDGHEWRSGRSGLIMTVADTGSGIAPDALARIFEAFFTTKEVGGTGLGLWVSQEIIARHEGRLRMRTSTQPGRSGTVFMLFLPADAAAR